MRLTPAVLLMLAMAGCEWPRRGDVAHGAAIDSSAPAGPMLSELPAEPPPDLLAREVRQACAAVAAYWSHESQATVRAFDSTATMPGTRSTTDACWVRVRVEDSRRLAAPPGGGPHVPFALSGWLPVLEFDADGPDGQSRVYQLDPVRCLVSERWDGGDDADTADAPAPWLEQEVACWRKH